MKKWIFVIGLIAVILGGGLYANSIFGHKPVHGIILLDQDKQKLQETVDKQEKNSKKVQVDGKWIEDEHTLILLKNEAQKLTELNALNKVSLKDDKYDFNPVKELPNEDLLLLTKDSSIVIKNDDGKEVTPKNTKYIVLGESSMDVKNILIVSPETYEQFKKLPDIYLTVVKTKKDTTKEIIKYKDLKIKQIYNPNN